MFAILKIILGFIPGLAGMFNAKEATRQAHEYARGQVGAAAVTAAGAEADATSRIIIARESGGFLGKASQLIVWVCLFHFTAVVIDSVFGFTWNIAALPGPMAEWEGAILVGAVVVNGADRALGRWMRG